MNNIKLLLSQGKEAMMYIMFGVLTTVVDYIVALGCFHFFDIGEIRSNNIAWVASVIFAYVTNKLFVFNSKSLEWNVLIKEIISFLSARVITLIMADIIIWIGAEVGIEFFVSKLISSVVVVIANYIFSKLIIFKKK